ncbi:DUF3857 domain-containing protein [Terracidiphilus sp.]|jgi:hypothetical protein|uniref:DUF3857 domain-containing protein n=1 Tax=Terracidiphilus sp. TaxID=1964191 RepID=UPI003C2420A0
MRSTRVLSSLVALILLGSCCLHAQFQKPTDDELKMTADPQYPDAAAIMLNYEEKTDDATHFTSHYARIKILRDSAKELATVSLGYIRGGEEVSAVSGRTIHSDGSITDLAVKPADLMRAKQGETEIHEVVFNLPAVETGSIIEYYYQFRRGERTCLNPVWDIQRPFPVRKAHYTFTPCPGYLDAAAGLSNTYLIDHHGNSLSSLLWLANLPGGRQLQPNAAHRFDLTLDNIPPIPHEAWMPPSDVSRYQVRFYFAYSNNGSDYWTKEGQFWLADVNRVADPSTAIKSAISGIVAPADSELDKAKKLYAAVQALDNTAYSRAKGDAELRAEGFRVTRRAEDIWQQKAGSPQEIALLYLAMLRAAGLTAYPMIVADREHTVFNPNYLNFGQLSGLVVVLNAGGKEMPLDPGEKMCPFGFVSWRHSGSGGVRQTASGPSTGITPLLLYSANVLTRRASLIVAPDGSVSGKLNFTFTGQQALHWRQTALRVDDSALHRDFDRWLQTQVPSGTGAHLVSFSNLDNTTADLTAEASVTGTPGTVTGKRILLPAAFFTNGETRNFTSETDRQLPVDMEYAAQVKDGVLYHLPTGYTVEAAPAAANIPWPNHAVYVFKPAQSDNGLNIGVALTRAFTILDPGEYAQLRDFYQKVATASQQQVVVVPGDAAKGN